MTPRHRSGRPLLRRAVAPGPTAPSPGRHRRQRRRRFSVRRVIAAAPLLILAAAVVPWLFSVTPLGTPAAHAAAVFVQVTPDTVTAGGDISIRASCDDNLVEAKASSPLFDTVSLMPQSGFLTGTAAVPSGTEAGDYQVTLTCADQRTANTTVRVMDDGPTQTTEPPPCQTQNPSCPATCPATCSPVTTAPSCPATCRPACQATCPTVPAPSACSCPSPTTIPTTEPPDPSPSTSRPPSVDPSREPPTSEPPDTQPSEPGTQGLRAPAPGVHY